MLPPSVRWERSSNQGWGWFGCGSCSAETTSVGLRAQSLQVIPGTSAFLPISRDMSFLPLEQGWIEK